MKRETLFASPRKTCGRGRFWLALAIGVFAASARPGSAANPCLECHGHPGLGLEGRPLGIHADAYAAGVHGRLACTDCHKGAAAFPHSRDLRVRCDLLCHVPTASHEALMAAEAAGVHAGVADPPCLGCHDGGAAPTRAESQAICLACHKGLEPPRRLYPDTVGAFGAQAHRRARPGSPTPQCVDCHGYHGMESGLRARRSCGRDGCHAGSLPEFALFFDHGGVSERKPWGGARPAFVLLGAAVGIVLLFHAFRG